MASDGYGGCSPSDKILGVPNRVGGTTAGRKAQEKAPVGLTRATRDEYGLVSTEAKARSFRNEGGTRTTNLHGVGPDILRESRSNLVGACGRASDWGTIFGPLVAHASRAGSIH